MVEKWNDGFKSVKIPAMCLLFHHSSVLQHSTIPLLHCSVIAKKDWSNKDIAILTRYYT
jgi:hypothetical protein